MKKDFKIKKYLWIVVLFLMFIPNFVLGQQQPAGGGPTLPVAGNNQQPAGGGPTPPGGGPQLVFQNPLKGTTGSIPQLINNIFDAVIQIALVFIIFAIIYSGFLFVKAQGNPEKLSEAKRIFLYTIIGGVILLGASAITEVVCNTANQFLSPPISC